MTTKLKHIIEEAKELSARERAFIARCLISSLDVPAEEGAEEAWMELAEERFKEIESGEVESVEWDQIKKQVKK